MVFFRRCQHGFFQAVCLGVVMAVFGFSWAGLGVFSAVDGLFSAVDGFGGAVDGFIGAVDSLPTAMLSFLAPHPSLHVPTPFPVCCRSAFC